MYITDGIRGCDINDKNNKFCKGIDTTPEEDEIIDSAESVWRNENGLHGGKEEWYGPDFVGDEEKQRKDSKKKWGYCSKIDITTIIRMAKLLKCRVVVRNGETGKWYLKGKHETKDELKEKIERGIEEKRYKFRNRILYFIEYYDDA
jgi:hypothetical protein